MTQAGAYGQRLGQFLRLKEAPPALVARSLRSAELAVTETRNDHPVPGLSGSLAAEDAFLVSLKLHDYPDCELWEHGKSIMKADVRAGTTYLYDLKSDPRYVIDKPFHSLFFYIPRSALDSIAEQCNAPRVDELDCQIGVGHDDGIIRHIGASLQQGLRRPDEANQLFIDHRMLGLTAHVAQTYGGLQRTPVLSRGGLAPWQAKRACERFEADLSGKLSLQKVAAELDLSVSHF
jgi:AraC family transcriptional regulator